MVTRLITAATVLTLTLQIIVCAQSLRVDYDEGFVAKTVRSGMTREELYSYFGQPVTETKASDSSSVLFYFKRTKHDGAQNIFGGFEVYVRSNKVVGWDAIRTNDSKR